MSKPTLLQSLLNQPSRSYFPKSEELASQSDPQTAVRHNYYSAKPELIRIAQQEQFYYDEHLSSSGHSSRRSSIASSYAPRQSLHPSHIRQRRLSAPGSDAASRLLRVSNNSRRSFSSPLSREVETHEASSRATTPALVSSSEERSDSDTDPDEVFYTPNTSPRHSMDASWVSLADHTISATYPDRPKIKPSSTSQSELSLASFSKSSECSSDQFTTFSFASKMTASTDTTVASSQSKRFPVTSEILEAASLQHISLAQVEPASSVDSSRDYQSLTLTTLDSSYRSDNTILATASSNPRRRAFNAEPSRSYQVEVIASSCDINTARSRRAAPHKRQQANAALKRMSAVIEEDEIEERKSLSTESLRSSIKSHRRSSSRLRRRTSSNPVRIHSNAHDNSMNAAVSLRPISTSSRVVTYHKVDVPAPLPMLGLSAPAAFTQLVLPKASYQPSEHPGTYDNTIDLISQGLAQTSMCSIEIQKDAAAALSIGRWGSIRSQVFGRSRDSISEKLETVDPFRIPTLGFSAHLSPPSRIGPHQVLVQVWAVGLDGLDGLLVQEKSTKAGNVGFVPGRSFAGRAIEVGFHVASIQKGEWVYGLLDIQKCGALTEFVTVDKRRVHRAPRCTDALTIDQVSLLPLFGIPAQRAISSLARRVTGGCKVLVLQAHCGPAALVCRALKAKGVSVTGQIPRKDQDANTKLATMHGASTVIANDPLNALTFSQESHYDAVLDTVGGKQIWNASKRVLNSTGQFITVIGDCESAVPTINVQFKTNLRSLRATFVKTDKKHLGYTWVSASACVDHEGEDIHDTLQSIFSMANAGVFRPCVEQVIPFERAVDSLPHPIIIGEPAAKSVVVRVLG